MLRKTLALPILAGLLAALARAGSALFTSTAIVGASTFMDGTVIISTSPTTALITFSNMAPGDEVTAPLTVSNDGPLQLRYAMTTSATDTDSKHLASQLVLNVKSGVTTCTKAGFGSSGTSVYSGSLTSGAIGNPATRGQAGDRTLDASTNEVLCFHVSLPLSSANTYQNATTTATFTFVASCANPRTCSAAPGPDVSRLASSSFPARAKSAGSSTSRRGSHRYAALASSTAFGGRPRRLGGFQTGGGTLKLNNSSMLQR